MKIEDTKPIEQCAGKKDVRYYLNNPYLDVENKRVQAGEHLRRWATRLSVEAEHGQIGRDMPRVGHRTLLRAGQPMLGTEEGHEVNIRGRGQQLGGGSPGPIAPGVIRDQPDPATR